jgi:hypothetical protein
LGVRSDASRRRRQWIGREPLDPCQPRSSGLPASAASADTHGAQRHRPSPRRPVEIAPTWCGSARHGAALPYSKST